VTHPDSFFDFIPYSPNCSWFTPTLSILPYAVRLVPSYQPASILRGASVVKPSITTQRGEI